MTNIVQGFNTSKGLAQYDYNSLANLPAPPSEYELPVAGSTLGGVKNGGNVVVSSDGTMNVQIEQPTTNSLDLDMLRDSKKRPGRLMVSFMDDDCRVEVVRGNNNEGSLENLINEKEIPYTLSCAPDNINRKDVDAEGNVTKEYMTLDDLKRMVNNGVTISSHARKEYNMSQFGTVEEFIEDIKICNNKFAEWGIPVSTMAYPQGDYVDDYLPDLKKYYNMGFTVENGINEIPYESYYMKRVGLFTNKETDNYTITSEQNLITGLNQYQWLTKEGKHQNKAGESDQENYKDRYVSNTIKVTQGEQYKVICSAINGGSACAFWGPKGAQEPLTEVNKKYIPKDSNGLLELIVVVPPGASYLVVSHNEAYKDTQPGVFKVQSKLDEAITLINKLAEKENGWLIFMTHAWYKDFSSQMLKTLIDYISSFSKIEIVDIHEAIHTTGNIVEIGEVKKPLEEISSPFFMIDAAGTTYFNNLKRYTRNPEKKISIRPNYNTGIYLAQESGSVREEPTEPDHVVSVEFEVKPGEKYQITCAAIYGNLLYCVYDESRTKVYGPPSAGSAEGTVGIFEYIIPENGRFMRVSSNKRTQPDGFKIFRIDSVKVSKEPDIWSGMSTNKKIVGESGFKIGNTGKKITGEERHWVSEEIKVSPGDQYLLSCSANYGNNLYAIYDKIIDSAGKEQIILRKGLSAPSDVDGMFVNKLQVTIPNGANYMLLAWDKKVTDISYEAIKIGTVTRPLEGIQVSIIGDSIVEKNNTASINFVDIIAQETGAKITNLGKGGTGYTKGNSSTGAASFMGRVADIPENTEKLLIYGSGNDHNFVSSGLVGTPMITDPETGKKVFNTATDTLCGCINATIDAIYQRLPKVWLGVIAPAPWASDPPFEEENNNMLIITQSLQEICSLRGIPFLNLYKTSGLRPWDESFNQLAFSNADGTHPNNIGHAMIAPQIKAFLMGSINN